MLFRSTPVLIGSSDTNRTRLVRKARPTESFFNFFSPPVPPSEDAVDEFDEEDLDELDEKLELDYQIGEDIKEKVSSWYFLLIELMLIQSSDHPPCRGLLHRQGIGVGRSR